jgi:hypothetical protein
MSAEITIGSRPQIDSDLDIRVYNSGILEEVPRPVDTSQEPDPGSRAARVEIDLGDVFFLKLRSEIRNYRSRNTPAVPSLKIGPAVVRGRRASGGTEKLVVEAM